uniref:Glutathione synthetase n=1 Tax=Gentiana triflora TaxID=55190 RepID=A0A090A0Q0_GENTR|nr:glutathione synthetase [Gentiana triflora]
MGSAYSSSGIFSLSSSTIVCSTPGPTTSHITIFSHQSLSNSCLCPSSPKFVRANLQRLVKSTFSLPISSAAASLPSNLNCVRVEEMETEKAEDYVDPIRNPHSTDPELIQTMAYEALVWSSLHGFVVGDRNSQRSGKVPGVGLVHAPFSLLPMPFPEVHWTHACEIAPIFNELIDRVSLDGKFLQDSLARTKKVDEFTSRLLDIHSKMLEINKKEEVRLGLHRSDYMLDEQTKSLLQIELNTISSSFPGLSSLVSELHRMLLHQFKHRLSMNPESIPRNYAVNGFALALSKAWTEYNNQRGVIMVVVQPEERNMYDQHWLCTVLKEIHQVKSIRKTLAEIEAEGELQADGTLVVGGEIIAVVYFRAGYAPTDYPSESEWKARLLIEQSDAIKCPSIAYHLAGTKKIQQELAKSEVLERFLENKDDIAKLRKCFAGLWSLDDSSIIKEAIERPGLYVMKPQREGGGNNIYGNDVKETLLRLQQQQEAGTNEDAAYILMQRIFPAVSPAILIRDGIYHKEQTVSELGVYGAYLRNKTKVIMNEHCGYLMRTKVSSSNEGGVAAGYAVLDSIYLV